MADHDQDVLRIVLDVQAMQTPDSRFRGIGNYVGMATSALMGLATPHRLAITSNLAFPTPDLIVPDGVEWVQYRARAGTPWGTSSEARKVADELVRHCWAGLNPDVIHIGSLSEGFSSGAPVPRLPAPCADHLPLRSAFLFDLIPLRFPDHYLNDKLFAAWYADQCEALEWFDVLFSISESTRHDAINLLGIPGHRIVNVGGACHPRYRRLSDEVINRDRLRADYGISRDFILSVSGDEYRKNIPRLIEAYAAMSEDVRNAFDLVVVCRLSDSTRQELEQLLQAFSPGVRERIRFLGFVPDDDLVRLYNDCSLFVFPSFYEGLGIPVIEALRCGAPAIAGENSSLTELVADHDRRFDALDPNSIAACMQRHLVRTPLSHKDREANVTRAQSHSWVTTGARMVEEWEGRIKDRRTASKRSHPRGTPKRELPRLAMFTPLPSVASGIADYSFEFIPHLAKHFSIDVYLGEHDGEFDRLPAGVEHAEWLQPGGYDASEYYSALYEMGNSEFHAHMLSLMVDHPGVVTLHDAYISGLIYHLAQHKDLSLHKEQVCHPGSFEDLGLKSHGGAFRRILDGGTEYAERAVLDWPVSLPVFEKSLGVISHTPFNLQLAYRLLGHRVQCPYRVVPLARDLPAAVTATERERAKTVLGFASDDVVITTFGHVSWHKLGDVLVKAFARSRLSNGQKAHLVFAGGLAEPHFGEILDELIEIHGLAQQVRVTGFLEREMYETHLAATDLAVQLRVATRGGTSAATVDAVARGIPVIANDYGSFSDYPSDTISFVPPRPTPDELATALDRFPDSEMVAGAIRGREFIRRRNDPSQCAAAYARFIHESVDRERDRSVSQAARRIGRAIATMPAEAHAATADTAARELARQENRLPTRQLLLEISRTNFERRTHRTGIQRVVRSVSREALRSERVNLDVRLLAIDDDHVVTDLREFQRELGVLIPGESASFRSGSKGPQDTLLLLDFDLNVFNGGLTTLRTWKEHGGRLVTVLYDLIPLHFPQHVPTGASELFEEWLQAAVRESDGIVCISKPVADDLLAYIEEKQADIGSGLDIGYWPLGTQDLGQPVDSTVATERDLEALTFLMVSTVEPRKGHSIALDAFERLWGNGASHRLRVIGREGWNSESLVSRIRSHSEFGGRLVWVDDADDAALAAEYAQCDAVLIASEAEGFGLTAVEGLSFGKPVIARDLPVFRDFQGSGLSVFQFSTGEELADALLEWRLAISRDVTLLHPPARVQTNWEASVEALLEVVIDGSWYQHLESN
jgi:glycosyltransferase involved in cell wall biosynthesis